MASCCRLSDQCWAAIDVKRCLERYHPRDLQKQVVIKENADCKMPAAGERGAGDREAVSTLPRWYRYLPLKIDNKKKSRVRKRSGQPVLLPRNTRTHGRRRRRRQEGRDRSAALQPHAVRGAGAARGAAAHVGERFGGLAGFLRGCGSRISAAVHSQVSQTVASSPAKSLSI